MERFRGSLGRHHKIGKALEVDFANWILNRKNKKCKIIPQNMISGDDFGELSLDIDR